MKKGKGKGKELEEIEEKEKEESEEIIAEKDVQIKKLQEQLLEQKNLIQQLMEKQEKSELHVQQQQQLPESTSTTSTSSIFDAKSKLEHHLSFSPFKAPKTSKPLTTIPTTSKIKAFDVPKEVNLLLGTPEEIKSSVKKNKQKKLNFLTCKSIP